MKPNGWIGLLLQAVALLVGLGAIYGKLSSDMAYNNEAHVLIRTELKLVQANTDAARIAIARLESGVRGCVGADDGGKR